MKTVMALVAVVATMAAGSVVEAQATNYGAAFGRGVSGPQFRPIEVQRPPMLFPRPPMILLPPPPPPPRFVFPPTPYGPLRDEERVRR